MNNALTPSDMKPDYDYLPFAQTIADIGNGFIGLFIIVSVVGVAAGALMFFVGKLFAHSDRMTNIGAGVFIVAFVAVAIMAGSGQLTEWATTVKLIGDTAEGAGLTLAPAVLPYL